MDVHSALEEVTRWCARQTEADDPDRIELDCHAIVWITIAECAPPWCLRMERGCSSGASAPLAQLRYDSETRQWALHHGDEAHGGWCAYEDAVHARHIGSLLDEIQRDRSRFRGLPPGFRWRLSAGD